MNLILIDTVIPAILCQGTSVEQLTHLADKLCPTHNFLVTDCSPDSFKCFTLSELSSLYYHLTHRKVVFTNETKTRGEISKLAYNMEMNKTSVDDLPKPKEINIMTDAPIEEVVEQADEAETKPKKVIRINPPKEGTTSARIWELAKQYPGDRKNIMEICASEGINSATAATQYGRYLKFVKQENAPEVEAEVVEQVTDESTIETVTIETV